MPRPVSIKDLIGPGGVVAGLESETKKNLLEDLSRLAAGALGLEEHAVFDVLWEREKLGTTGVGQGIAIPHGRMVGLDAVHGLFVRLAKPVPYEAADDKPVDLVFMLIAPEDAGADHLHALATVSRTLRDVAFCEKLRQAGTAKDIEALFAHTVIDAAA